MQVFGRVFITHLVMAGTATTTQTEKIILGQRTINMNRVFKITAHRTDVHTGRKRQIKKRIYESEKKFRDHCIQPVRVQRVTTDGTMLISEYTYDHYIKLYPIVKLWELIDEEWVEIKKDLSPVDNLK